MAGEAAHLSQLIVGALDQMIIALAEKQGISPQEIDAMVITGNTVMLYLLAGQDTTPLSRAPFIVDRLFGEEVTSQSLGFSFSPECKIYFPRCISAFVGADITTALLASGMTDTTETSLLVDIGTNGELALWHKGKLYCCSTAAGPAFEGAGITMGCYDIRGAIDKIWVENGQVEYSTIANQPAVGICGSGIIDAISVLRQLDVIDESGALETTGHAYEANITSIQDIDGFDLGGGMVITKKDIRMVQLAKGSVRAGMETLLDVVGIQWEDVANLYIAGGFGSYINLENAAIVGLVPKELLGNIHVIGNAAQSGASMVLQNHSFAAETDKIAKNSKTIELSSNPIFMENYMAYMLFEEL